MLRRFLQHLYEAIRNHKLIDSIDCALKQGDFQSLARLCNTEDYKKIFGCVNSQTSDTTSVEDKPLVLQQPKLSGLESELIIQDASMIQQLESLLAYDPEFPCCSCERLHQRKNVTAFKFSESKKFTSDMWQTLKAYMYGAPLWTIFGGRFSIRWFMRPSQIRCEGLCEH